MSEYEIKEVFLNSSSPYLIAREGMWINADREEISFDEMDTDYKTNCLRLLEKEKSNIMSGRFLSGVKFDKEKYGPEIIHKAMELYTRKTIELKEALVIDLKKKKSS